MKTCRECGEPKPLSEFYEHKAMADGHLNKCKSCVRKRVGSHREANIDSIRKYDRERGSLSHRREAREVYQKGEGRPLSDAAKARWASRNQRKRAAEILFNNRRRFDPLLAPHPCVRCGTEERVHAHHEDYDKPLEVVWLCPQHHQDRHKEMRAEGLIP